MTFRPGDVDAVKQRVRLGEERRTKDLDGTTTTETLRLKTPAQVISYQRTGSNLTADVAVSINGVDFDAATAISDSTINTYNSSLVKAIRITRTAGEGQVVLMAR